MTKCNMYPFDIEDISIDLPSDRMNFGELMEATGFSETELLRALFTDTSAPEIHVLSFPTFFRREVKRYTRELKKRKMGKWKTP